MTSNELQRLMLQLLGDSSTVKRLGRGEWYLSEAVKKHAAKASGGSARTHEYDYFIQGLRKIRGVIDAVVVSRPGNMAGNPAGACS